MFFVLSPCKNKSTDAVQAAFVHLRSWGIPRDLSAGLAIFARIRRVQQRGRNGLNSLTLGRSVTRVSIQNVAKGISYSEAVQAERNRGHAHGRRWPTLHNRNAVECISAHSRQAFQMIGPARSAEGRGKGEIRNVLSVNMAWPVPGADCRVRRPGDNLLIV